MRIDRLYAITVYLLNHGKTSANELAKYFEVSSRTIQRDIDALCLAGIPVAAVTGASGGYELTDTFRMEKHAATNEDYTTILTALRGYATAANDPKVNATLEKVMSLTKAHNNGIILDFSVLREGDVKLLQLLESAVRTKHVVSFTYTNADNITRIHMVEPIAVLYRWYAWYLLAYSIAKDDYRSYKLVRMGKPEITGEGFSRAHASADNILRTIDSSSPQVLTEVTIRCKAGMKVRAAEYMNGTVIEELDNGDVIMKLKVFEHEHFWFGTMLSLGDSIEVLEPERIRSRVLTAARNIVSLYEKP